MSGILIYFMVMGALVFGASFLVINILHKMFPADQLRIVVLILWAVAVLATFLLFVFIKGLKPFRAGAIASLIFLGIYGTYEVDITFAPDCCVNPPTIESSPEKTAVQANLKTYQSVQYGFEFKYPQGLDFQPIADAAVVQSEVKSGLPSDPRVSSIRISVGVDATKANRESCTPAMYLQPSYTKNVAKQVQVGSNLFSKYYSPNLSGCGGYSCDAGNLYALWQNNTCYQLESSYQVDYLEKVFSCSAPGSTGVADTCMNASDYPKYLVAKESQQVAIEYINNLEKQILSTFKSTR